LSPEENVASFRMQASRTTLKAGFGPAQSAQVPPLLDKSHRLGGAHGLATIFAMRARQGRRQAEVNHPALNDCRCSHILKVTRLKMKTSGSFLE